MNVEIDVGDNVPAPQLQAVAGPSTSTRAVIVSDTRTNVYQQIPAVQIGKY